MSIRATIQKVGMTSGDARQTLKSASWKREDVELHDPMGNIITNAKGQDVLSGLSQAAKDKGLTHPLPVRNGSSFDADYLAFWEKQNALDMMNAGLVKSKIRDTSARYGAAKEWDEIVVSVDQAVSDQELATIREEALKELRSPATLGTDNVGQQGHRAVIASTMHDNTGHKHLHFLVNRHAFDMQGKEVAVAIDLSNSGMQASFMQNLEQRLRDKGILHPFEATSSTNKAITQNTVQQAATQSTQQQVADAGGFAPDQTLTATPVAVPQADGTQAIVAQPLNVDAEGIARHSVLVKAEITRRNEEIRRQQEEVQRLAATAATLDQATQAIAEKDALTEALTDTQKALETTKHFLEEAGVQLTERNAAIEALEAEKEALMEREAAWRDRVVSIGNDLAESPYLDDATKEALRQGDPTTVLNIASTMRERADEWENALSQAEQSHPELIARHGLRDDPLQGLDNLLVEHAYEQQKNANLAQERDGLQLQLSQSQATVQTLQAQAAETARQMAALDAAMAKQAAEFERRMDEQVEKVKAAEIAAAKAEGKVEATEQRLVEKSAELAAAKAETKALERLRDGIVQVVVYGQKADDVYRTTPELRDHDASVKAIEKWLEVRQQAAESETKVLRLENDVLTLKDELAVVPGLRTELAEAKAEAEEHLRQVNDGHAKDIADLVEKHTELAKRNDQLQSELAEAVRTVKTSGNLVQKQAGDLEKALANAARLQEELTAAQEALAAKVEEAAKPAATGWQGPDADEQRMLDFLAKNPAIAALVKEAQDNESVAGVLEGIQKDLDNPGMRPAEGTPPGQGEDWEAKLKESDKKPSQSKKRNDPSNDQS